MSFRNISAWAIRNPVAPIVLFIALTLAGIMAFMQMKVNNNPDVSFPAAQVSVTQPGAAPTELETQVTQKVEAALRSINGVEDMSSYIQEGTSNTTVQFAIGTPVDRAVNDVRDAIANIRSDLPEGILEPQVNRLDIDGGPIAYFSAEATDMTLEQLSWFVDNTVAKRLVTVSGMANIQRSGGVKREIRVVLDPVRMQAQGVTASQVNAQLRATNLNAAGGRAEIAGSEQSVRVLGNAASAFALGEKMISVGGRTIKLTDIATVRDSYAEQRNISKMGGKQVLSFAMAKSKGASDVLVYDEGVKLLRAMEKENPKVKFRQLFTTVDYTRSQYHSAIDAMWEGAILAVLVVFVFLRDWRATLISAIAIPLSAIPAFWFMDLMGFTLNGVSLIALSLVAGVLVDDAIVEIENIVRHMRRLSGLYRCRRRDRAGGAGDDNGDCRGVPAGRPDAGHIGTVLQTIRHDHRCRRAGQPRRRAPHHTNGGSLFPQVARPRLAWRRAIDGPLYGAAPLVARHAARARAACGGAALAGALCRPPGLGNGHWRGGICADHCRVRHVAVHRQSAAQQRL